MEDSELPNISRLSIQEPVPERPAEQLSPRYSHVGSLNPHSVSRNNITDQSSDTEIDEFEAEHGTTPPPPVSFKTVLLQFIKQLATSSSVNDLHQLTCPAIMLNGISLLEYGIHWAEYPEILAEIGKSSNPKERIIAVCKWFISCLHGSYASRSKTAGFERKPYNPILGEQFHAIWPDEFGFGETVLTAEQVSHHPPITGFYLRNEKADVHISGSSGQHTRFTGTAIKAEQTGRIFVYLSNLDEEYAITLPELHVRGLLTGSPFVELTGEVVIIGTNGIGARLKFIPKPWFSGEYDGMEGLIADLRDRKQPPIFTLRGKWSDRVEIISEETGKQQILFDIRHIKRDLLPEVKSISKQTTLESRRVWWPVTKALRRSNYTAANEAKNAIEEEQRALRKKRESTNQQWEPKLFKFEEFAFIPGLDDKNASDTDANSSSNLSTGSQRSSTYWSSTDSSEPSAYTGRWIHADFYKKYVEKRL